MGRLPGSKNVKIKLKPKYELIIKSPIDGTVLLSKGYPSAQAISSDVTSWSLQSVYRYLEGVNRLPLGYELKRLDPS